MGYPYHLHALIRPRCFHHQPRRPMKQEWYRKRIGESLQGFGWSCLKINLRMEPALPLRKRAVGYHQLPARKRLTRSLQFAPRQRPVQPQRNLSILRRRVPQNPTSQPLPAADVPVPTTMTLMMRNTQAASSNGLGSTRTARDYSIMSQIWWHTTGEEWRTKSYSSSNIQYTRTLSGWDKPRHTLRQLYIWCVKW